MLVKLTAAELIVLSIRWYILLNQIFILKHLLFISVVKSSCFPLSVLYSKHILIKIMHDWVDSFFCMLDIQVILYNTKISFYSLNHLPLTSCFPWPMKSCFNRVPFLTYFPRFYELMALPVGYCTYSRAHDAMWNLCLFTEKGTRN